MKKAITDLDFEAVDRIGLQAARDAVSEHVRAGRLPAIDRDEFAHGSPLAPTVDSTEIVSINLNVSAVAVIVMMIVAVFSLGSMVNNEFENTRWAAIFKNFWELTYLGTAIASMIVAVVAKSKLNIRISRSRETHEH